MNLDRLIEKTGPLARAAGKLLQGEVETIAGDALALSTHRIVETGIDAGGQPYKPYTRAYELRKRAAVGTARREGKKRRAARREAEASPSTPVGRFRGFVDFTLTGQMLASQGVSDNGLPALKNVGVKSSTQSRERIVVVIGPRDAHTQEKMEGNAIHRPKWNNISTKEIETLARQSAERLAEKIEQFLTN